MYDTITRRKESFHTTVSNIIRLKKLHVYVKANTTVMKQNMDNIDATSRFIYKLTEIRGKLDIIRNIGLSKKDLIPVKLNRELGNIRTKAKFKGINKQKFLENYSGNTCCQGKIKVICDGKVSLCIMENNSISDK